MLEAIITLSSVGFIAGCGLLYAAKKFVVIKDENILKINEMLPGANCGGCGYPGCLSLAEAIVNRKASPTACPIGGMELAKNIGVILGLEIADVGKKVARVKCRGTVDKCPLKYDYMGPGDCHSIVMLAGGNKLCSYGCVGGGSCVTSCNFDAIYMSDQDIPIVKIDKCTSCGMCVKACPRDIIELTDVSKSFFVTCRSNDKGAIVRKICSIGCIGCGLCVKKCPENAIILENNLAKILSEKCTNCGICKEVCPTKSIAKF